MRNIRSKLVTAAAIGAATIGGAAIANAATSSTTTSSTSPPLAAAGLGRPPLHPSHGGHRLNGRTETSLTGAVAAKVRATALDKVSGTVERVETNVDDGAPYEAHIAKPDGTQVIVEVNRDYSVHAVQTMAGHP